MPPLVGSACGACGVVTHPVQADCARCGDALEPRELATSGVVWTWTVQRFAPRSPPYVAPEAGFARFAVGYVELDDGVKVEARLECADLEALHIGAPADLIPGPGVPRFSVKAT